MSEAALAPAAPDPALTWDDVKALVLDSVSSPHSKRAYSRALEHFARWAKEEGQGTAFGKALVQRYRSRLEENGLAPSSINVQLAALRKLAMEAADNGLLDPAVASAISRVKGAAQKGRRIGRWLTREEASLLLRDSGEDSLKAKRDRALLCLLLGAGLRREELVSLEIGHIQQREGRWVIADLVGKRKRIRTAPIPGWAKVAIDHWTDAASITEGRTVPRGRQGWPGHRGDALRPGCLPCRHRAGKKNRARARAPRRPADICELAHKGKAPIEQIQIALGHESIQTTERYLGVRQDLTDAPCDHLGIELEEE
jgi:site-specific recombinase XerD